ncbi:hypothetical protein [Streptomyces puniciscabiei]|uniref:hypothetical protein n=1 Tax=Streptomyces puniciscabiei TaxID=164348 RepID=UPI0037B7551F
MAVSNPSSSAVSSTIISRSPSACAAISRSRSSSRVPNVIGLKAAADGETNPDSWTAEGFNGGGGGTTNTTYAYAICSGSGIDVSAVTVKVHYSEVSGPTSATTGQTVTVGCGTDGKLVSGGAAISGGGVTTTDFTGPGSGGDHLNGSFPRDNSGNPVSDGTTSAAYWTAYTHTGGAGSANTYSDVWALCANDGV